MDDFGICNKDTSQGAAADSLQLRFEWPEEAQRPLSPSKQLSKQSTRCQRLVPRCDITSRCARLCCCLQRCRRSQDVPAEVESKHESRYPGLGVASTRREIVMMVLALFAIAAILASLLDTEPHLFAAALAAALGWHAIYALMLQGECQRLNTWLHQWSCDRVFDGRGSPKVPTEPSFLPEAAAWLASTSLGADFDIFAGASGAFGYMQPSMATTESQTRNLVQSVLTASLVNEYMKLAACLRRYRERFGPLPKGTPGCDSLGLGAAEALVAAGWGMPVPATEPPAALPCTDVNMSLRDVEVIITPRSVAVSSALADEAGVSGVAELREGIHCNNSAVLLRPVSIESPSPSPAMVSVENPLAATEGDGPGAGYGGLFGSSSAGGLIASIEDSINLPPWLRQIRA